MYGGKGVVTGGMTGAGGLAYTGAPVFAVVVLGLALLLSGLLVLRSAKVRRGPGRHQRA